MEKKCSVCDSSTGVATQFIEGEKILICYACLRVARDRGLKYIRELYNKANAKPTRFDEFKWEQHKLAFKPRRAEDRPTFLLRTWIPVVDSFAAVQAHVSAREKTQLEGKSVTIYRTGNLIRIDIESE